MSTPLSNLAELLNSETWMEEGLCAEVGNDFWFPEKGESTKEAKRICAGCSVRARCLQFALDNSSSISRFGVWGGTSERERRVLLKLMDRAPRKAAA